MVCIIWRINNIVKCSTSCNHVTKETSCVSLGGGYDVNNGGGFKEISKIIYDTQCMSFDRVYAMFGLLQYLVATGAPA